MADIGLSRAPSSAPSGREVLGWLLRGEVALALGIIGIIVLLILPVPSFMLDMLLAMSVARSKSFWAPVEMSWKTISSVIVPASST